MYAYRFVNDAIQEHADYFPVGVDRFEAAVVHETLRAILFQVLTLAEL